MNKRTNTKRAWAGKRKRVGPRVTSSAHREEPLRFPHWIAMKQYFKK